MSAIYERNAGYEILHVVANIATHCHYQRTVIRGRENLPQDGIYILAPCHQNALMEPMALMASLSGCTVFLARADIFANPTIRAILTFFKILPVYRIRDGKSNLSKNEAIFEQSCQVLLHGVPLCLMAEGRHNDRHQLLPLVKGMFRIAGEAQRSLGDTPLYIVPTGIDFDHYERPYSCLVVDIGTPIAIKPFMECYEHEEPVALNQMRNALTTALKRQMHHIESHKYYDEVYLLCQILNPAWRAAHHRADTAWQRFVTRRDIAMRINEMDPDTSETTPEYIVLAHEYAATCRKRHLDPVTAAHPWHPLLTLLVTVAIASVAAAIVALPEAWHAFRWILLCNPLIVIPTHLIAQLLIQDTQFRSSVNYGIRLVLSVLYAVGLTIAVACSCGIVWGVAALATLLISARINAVVHPLLRRWIYNLHRLVVGVTHPAVLRRLRQIQQTLQSTIRA